MPSPATAALQLPRRGAPIGAIAYSIEGTTLHVGFSLQNPKDHWNRKRAREIALARLGSRRIEHQIGGGGEGTEPMYAKIEEPHYFALEFTPPTEGQFRPYDAVERIYSALTEGEVKAPARLQRALKQMLKDNEQRVRILAELHDRSTAHCDPIQPAPVSGAY